MLCACACTWSVLSLERGFVDVQLGRAVPVARLETTPTHVSHRLVELLAGVCELFRAALHGCRGKVRRMGGEVRRVGGQAFLYWRPPSLVILVRDVPVHELDSARAVDPRLDPVLGERGRVREQVPLLVPPAGLGPIRQAPLVQHLRTPRVRTLGSGS